jgi:hypothetical protein
MKKKSFLVFLENYGWIFLTIIIFLILFTYRYYFEKVITVKKLDYIKDGRNYGDIIITDSDNNLYTVSNYAKLSNQFQINQKYKIKGYSSRISILGRYKNIIGAEII